MKTQAQKKIQSTYLHPQDLKSPRSKPKTHSKATGTETDFTKAAVFKIINL